MKKKYITETYLRGVDDCDIKIIKEEKFDCYTCVKHIKSIDKQYITSHLKNNLCLLDTGYYIIEYIPLNEQYIIRIFMNEKKEILQYYIDITKENGIENDIPFYYDLYLDITIDVLSENLITLWDESELIEAVKSKDVSSEDYTMAHNIADKLLNQIKNNENKYITRDHKKIVNELMSTL